VVPPPRELLLFVGRFVALFAVLMVPWRALGSAYSLAFSITTTTALEIFVDEREFRIRFEPTEDPWGVRFLGTDVQTGKRTELGIEAREIGYVPAATLLALVFAAPLSNERRRRALLWGTLVIGGRVALAVGLPVAHYVGATSAGSLAENMALAVFHAVVEPPDMAYATPVIAFLVALGLPQAGPTGRDAPAEPSRARGARRRRV
jgi:hypothetical protein